MKGGNVMKINITVDINKEDLQTIVKAIMDNKREQREEKWNKFKKDFSRDLEKILNKRVGL